MKPSPSSRCPIAARWLTAALFAFALGACGFQPRGQALSGASLPSPIFIAGVGEYSTLRREIERQLETTGVAIAPAAGQAAAILRISDWNRDSRLLSVNSRNQAVEYELEESAQFSLYAGNGQELVATQGARVSRIQYRPETAVLGSSREAELLREDMQRELAEHIVRRLAAQH